MKRIVNKNAYRICQVEDKLESGIVLLGSEVKAIRTRGVELKDAIVRVKDSEAFLVNAVVNPYPFSRREDYDQSRERRLLLKEGEIKRLINAKKAKLTIVPLACYTKGRWIKIQLGIGKIKGKRQRKQDLIARDWKKRLRTTKE